MFGIQDEDYVPADKVHEVYYVQRTRKVRMVKWRMEKRIRHTEESFPPVAGSRDDGSFDINSSYMFYDRYMESFIRFFSGLMPPLLTKLIDARNLTVLLLSSLCSSLCIGVTCFSIAPFAGAFEHQPWTYYYATFGLFGSVIIPNVIWSWVHMQEHHPLEYSDWVTLYSMNPDTDYPTTSSLGMKSAFAVSPNGLGFTTYDVKIVGGWLRRVFQILSCLASLSILLG